MIKNEIKADIVADSICPTGERVTTFVVVFPRIVLAEFNTHRMFSRNSASSRAIPFEKMLKLVKEDPFIPIKWMKDHKGMQGNEYFEEPDVIQSLETAWLEARDASVENALNVAIGDGEIGLTKQIVNRLLEPFMWHKVIVTATEWENFFALRAHDAAEIHIAKLAHIMLHKYNTGEPVLLGDKEWHIPFGDKMDDDRIFRELKGRGDEQSDVEWLEMRKIEIATARCARVSYYNYEGNDDYTADVKLHDNLVEMGHWSPFEHCAQFTDRRPGYCSGNLRQFTQYRKTFDDENKRDRRVASLID